MALSSVHRASLGTATLALLSSTILACEIPPRGPITLGSTQIVAVHLQSESGKNSICPGTDVPLLADVDALVPGESEPVRLHTKRDRVDQWLYDARDLHLWSDQGQIDDDAVFHANPDPRVSAADGFLVNVHAPTGPVFGIRFAPSYDCVHEVGKQGLHGLPGVRGDQASPSFNATANIGEEGAVGGEGGRGPTLTMYITWVRTAFSPKLLGIVSDGDVRGLTLAKADGSVELDARGGDGGVGGRGGEGGDGSDGQSQDCTSRRRRRSCTVTPILPAGTGGAGGRGGQGGEGGTLIVHIDARYPEIRDHLVLDARGGRGGEPGYGGPGGAPRVSYEYANATVPGLHGSPGAPGVAGPMGADGTATVLFDDVGAKFAGLATIQRI